MKQSFQIDINGKPETIEYEDDMAFGKLESIITRCANVSKDSSLLNNIQMYRKEIVLNALTKAPFDISSEGIDKVGYKVMQKITEEVLKAYPLGDYLNSMMKPFENLTNLKG